MNGVVRKGNEEGRPVGIKEKKSGILMQLIAQLCALGRYYSAPSGKLYILGHFLVISIESKKTLPTL